MNRHERRRAKVVVKRRLLSAVELRKLGEMGSTCAWRDCCATFNGEMPPGWTWLITHWAPHPIPNVMDMKTTRDAALCPPHAAALESALRSFGPLKPSKRN